MKLLLLFISFNLTLSYAQKLKFGPEIGFNLINVETIEIGNNFQVGWHTGAFAEYEFKKWFGVSAAVYYSQKRHSFNSSETTPNMLSLLLAEQGIEGVDLNTYSETNGRIALNTLQLPILAMYKYKNFNFNLGGYIGYMFNTRFKAIEIKTTPFLNVIDLNAIDPTIGQLAGSFLPPANETNFIESTDKNGLSTLDFGLKAGISYQVNSIGFNVNYIHGLKDYRTSNSAAKIENNNYFQFSLSYIFGKGTLAKMNYSKL